jgi:preprotein translocase subunit YajC
MIAVTAALILFVYFSIKYFLLFREELKRDAGKKK